MTDDCCRCEEGLGLDHSHTYEMMFRYAGQPMSVDDWIAAGRPLGVTSFRQPTGLALWVDWKAVARALIVDKLQGEYR